MEKSEKRLRVLWFANTPGLSQPLLNDRTSGGGWISSLQSGVENSLRVDLGFVFYSDLQLDPFHLNKTDYYPIRRTAFTKSKRLLRRISGRAEYEENLARFLRIIKEFKPDIIHVHGTENSFGLIVKQVHDIPVIISIQGNLTVYARKYFSGISRPGLIRQWRSGYPFFGADFRIWGKRARIEREILKKARYVFGRTDWDRRICLLMAPGARYFHIEEVMREKFYRIRWEPLPDSSPVFFTTCSASFYKGFETILDTARILSDHRLPFTWIVAGLKEEDALVRLVKKIKKIDRLEDLNVRLKGPLSADELANGLLQANVYVQVSHIENSPNSLCEAMLAGMPVIASFAGGTASLVQDNITGILVQGGDPYVLAGALLEMIKYPQNSIDMAREAYRTAHQRHDPPAIVDRLLSAYSEIIEEHQAGGLPTIHKSRING
ncbi:MAG TPA: glycosyltransferase family 4 protein [Puia sp.]|jgi:glycosyltransferase involved in cell wall biosynthesis